MLFGKIFCFRPFLIYFTGILQSYGKLKDLVFGQGARDPPAPQGQAAPPNAGRAGVAQPQVPGPAAQNEPAVLRHEEIVTDAEIDAQMKEALGRDRNSAARVLYEMGSAAIERTKSIDSGIKAISEQAIRDRDQVLQSPHSLAVCSG